MKKRIAYVNEDSFIHVDLTVLPELAKFYDILWIPVIKEGFSEYPDGFLHAFAADNGISLQIQRTNLRLRSFGNFAFFTKIAKSIKRADCQLVFTAIHNPYWAIVSACFIRVPVVQGFHDFFQHSGFNQGKALQLSASLTAAFRHHFLFYSNTQLSLFHERYPHSHSACVGMAPLDYGKSSKTNQPLDSGVKLLFFGRIDSYKGLDNLISAMEKVYTEGISCMTLTIRGRGSFWPECEPLIVHRDMFDVEIRFVDNEEIPDLFCSHHFLVLPYRDTTQSGPMMLAINYGIPVIAPSLPAFLEHCNPENALLYDKEEGIEVALKKCASLSQYDYDALKRSWTGEYDRCSPPRVAERYACFFNEIIHEIEAR